MFFAECLHNFVREGTQYRQIKESLLVASVADCYLWQLLLERQRKTVELLC
jgi:hypothetical protein